MKGFNINVSAFERAFQKRPEVFQSVSVNVAACIAFQVVNNLAVIILFKIVVGHERIGANGRPCIHMRAHIAAKLRSSCIRNYFEHHARELVALATFKDALHGSFLNPGITNPRSTILVHVASLSADVCLVRLTSPVHLGNRTVLHCETDALKHEPRGFLSYPNRTVKLVRANTVFAVGSKPHCREPLIQTDWRIFKDRSYFCRKLLLWMNSLALPNFGVFKKRHALRTATRTAHAIRPANLFKELKSVLWIAEIRDCFEQGFRCVHATNLHL